ncbi:MAG: hypothetical protein GOMPHAMPRED_003803 [Gomphillus americanus]|uniref:Rhodopsin domain-containing protein n=1 Tax=Gomphillus americanus TaxID=1940652 RepID=A0A8H3FI72_9LECA|nr:MAG: hypothetical protein GOMPHAMPRED_003803 [Gomphillus americanus]
MALQCLPLSALWTVMGAFNIITDIVIIILPIPHLWGLKLGIATRLGLLFTFALGSITVVFSILRTVFVGSSSVQDASWNDVPAATYSSLEMNIGVISACLPTLRPLFFPQRQTSRSTGTRSTTADGFEMFNRPRSTVVMSRGGWNVMDSESERELGIHKQTTFTVKIEGETSKDIAVV